MFGFHKIIERRIQEAQKEGAFDDLPGKGKPLSLEDDSQIPDDLRLAYKILKNAGYIPKEVAMRKEIVETEDLLDSMEDTKAKYRKLKKLNFLITRLNIVRKTSVNLEMDQHYDKKLVERFGR